MANLDDPYFEWLYSKIAATNVKNPERTHRLLAEDLHRKVFRWHVPNDDNRAADGIQLRHEFISDTDYDTDTQFWSDPCSFLEMTIALARRIAYDVYSGDPDDGASHWVWTLLSNIDIAKYSDAQYTQEAVNAVEEALEAVIDRTYLASGRGGLFPIKHPTKDMRNIELWYQMSEYLLETGDY